MFKVIISDNVYHKIIQAEEKKTAATRSYLYKLLKQQEVKQLTGAETEYLNTHPQEVVKDPSALYILDITPAQAEDIQKAYGVLCLSGAKPDISPLIDVSDVFSLNPKECREKGWDTVLDSVEKLPTNALLLTDRYLFKKKYYKADGFTNIRDILGELLPQEFKGGDYHVTIIFNKKKIHDDYNFSYIATQLNNLKLSLGRDYPIMMEVLGITEDCSLHSSLHSRRIVSNSYLVEATHKLAAFNGKDKGTVSQDIIPWALFTQSSLNGLSSAPLDSINQTLTALLDFNTSLNYQFVHSTYSYALNGKCMEKCLGIRNRLLT